MKVLVIGSGGREHALIWKLKESPRVTEIYCAPGNPGIASIAKCISIQPEAIEQLVDFSREIGIDLTVVGPEAPLVSGIVDAFQQAGLSIIGPNAQGARLEGSKSYAKAFMEKYGVPTAKYHQVTTFEEGKALLKEYSLPVVIKADGLAAGKGVLICQTLEEAEQALEDILVKQVFGKAGAQVVIEEYLEGIETSVLCFVDGNTIVPMVGSQDHKRIYDQDLGPNTGGMGTYSPNYVYTPQVAKTVEETVLQPTLRGLQGEGLDYKGILFIGLMITAAGPKVLEYNVRFGDPETQVVLPRLQTDLVEIFQGILAGKLNEVPISWHQDAAVCVVLASAGYPESSTKGVPITINLPQEPNLWVFHAGTALQGEQLVTAGGRVLGVTAMAETIEAAREKAYRGVAGIHFEGMQFRRDIGIK